MVPMVPRHSVSLPRLLELAAVVSRLQTVCPWTQTQSAADMLAFTRMELVETEEAMGALAASSATAHLESELGDVLFNVLMLIEACGKEEHGTGGLERVCEASVAKLRRRAPYAFDGGPRVQTAEDADKLWQVRLPRQPASNRSVYTGAHTDLRPSLSRPTQHATFAGAQAGKDAEQAASEAQPLAAPLPAYRAASAQPDPAHGPSPGVEFTAGVPIASLSLLAGEAGLEGLEEWRLDLERDLAADSAASDADWQETDASSEASDGE
jgi:NTP pyrophosphatase (non-canonical NTP hydrolase)